MSPNRSLLPTIRARLRYLWRGLGLSVLVLLLGQAWCAWEVYNYAELNAPLPEHADAVVILGAAAFGEKPSPGFQAWLAKSFSQVAHQRLDS